MVIKFTVRTLSGDDHKFEEPDDITVASLRERIAERTGIAADQQRLIFLGRVIGVDQNDKKLSELGARRVKAIADKTLHVVSRPPPAPPPTEQLEGERNEWSGVPPGISGDTVRAIARRILDEHEVGRQMTVEVHEDARSVFVVLTMRQRQQVHDSAARERLMHFNRLLRQVHHYMYHLENDAMRTLRSPSASATPVQRNDDAVRDADAEAMAYPSLLGSCTEEAHERDVNGDVVDVFANERRGDEDESEVRETVRDAMERVLRFRNPPHPADVRATVEEALQRPETCEQFIRHANQATLHDASRLLRAAQARAVPIMEFYEEQVLIERECMSTPEAREHGRQFARFFQGVHAMQHLMAHALHAFSDLNLHLDEDPLPHRRLYPQLTVPPATELPNAEATLQLLRTAAGRNAYWASHRPHAFDGPVAPQTTAAQAIPTSGAPPRPLLFTHPSISVGAQGTPHAIPLGVHIQQIEVNVDPSGAVSINQQPVQAPQQQSQRPQLQQRINTGATTTAQSAGGIRQNAQQSRESIGASIGRAVASAMDSLFSGITAGVTRRSPTQQQQATAQNQMVQLNGQSHNMPPGAVPFAFAQMPDGTLVPLRPGTPVADVTSQLRQRLQQQRRSRSAQPPTQRQQPQASASTPPRETLTQRPQQSASTPQRETLIQQPQQSASTLARETQATARHQQLHHVHERNDQFTTVMQHTGSSMQFLANQLNNARPLREQVTNAFFVGPRPPVDMPLYTVDPVLTCISRHFEQYVRRQISANQPSTSATAHQGERMETEQQQSAEDVDNTDEAMLEREMRLSLNTVLEQMAARMELLSAVSDPQPTRIYAFTPIGNVARMPPRFNVHARHVQPMHLGMHGPQPVRLRPPYPQPPPQRPLLNPQQAQHFGDMIRTIHNFTQSNQEEGGGRMVSLLDSLGLDTNRALLNESSANEPAIMHLTSHFIAAGLRLSDMGDLIGGRAPEVLDGRRTELQNYARRTWLQEGDDITTAEGRHAIAARLSRQLVTTESSWHDLLQVLRLNDVMELVGVANAHWSRTIQSVERHYVRRILEIVLDNAANFGRRLFDACAALLSATMFFLDRMNERQPAGPNRLDALSVLIERSQNNDAANEHLPPGLLDTMTAMMPLIVAQLRSILANVPPLDRDTLHATIVENVITADEVPNVGSEETHTTTEVDLMHEQQSESPFQNEHEDEMFVDAPEAKAIPPPNDWRRLLPPEWHSVIAADVNASNVPQAESSYSDAYVSGMPAKRRRLQEIEAQQQSVAHTDNAHSSASLFASIMRDAVTRAQAQPVTGASIDDVTSAAVPAPLLTAFDTELQQRVRARIEGDTNYDTEKYPSIDDMIARKP